MFSITCMLLQWNLIITNLRLLWKSVKNILLKNIPLWTHICNEFLDIVKLFFLCWTQLCDDNKVWLLAVHFYLFSEIFCASGLLSVLVCRVGFYDHLFIHTCSYMLMTTQSCTNVWSCRRCNFIYDFFFISCILSDALFSIAVSVPECLIFL